MRQDRTHRGGERSRGAPVGGAPVGGCDLSAAGAPHGDLLDELIEQKAALACAYGGGAISPDSPRESRE